MRLFVAVEIPDEIKEKLWKAAKELEIKGVILQKKETYHITLQFFGEVPESSLQGIKDTLSSITADRFNVELLGISSFDPTLRVLFADVKAGAQELKSIYGKIDTELERNGITYKKENEYKPHLTLARVKFLKDKTLLLPIIGKYSSFKFGSFQVRSIILKESRQTENGYVYRNLYEFEF